MPNQYATSLVVRGETELSHHGIKGMKWGRRRFQNADGSLTPAGRQRYADNPQESRKTQKLKSKQSNARESAKEWDEMADYAESRGKTKRAEKFRKNADADRRDADYMESDIKASQREDKFRATRKDISASRKTGHKLATNILAGPFANRTYNSVIAAGGSRPAAIGVTLATGFIGGAVGHLAISALYTKTAGDGNTIRDYD